MSDASILYVFPGQGSQYRGMGSDLCADFAVARDVYEQANEVLKFDLKQLSFEDPANEIGLTRNTQPALLTHEVACLRVFDELTGGKVKPKMAAGHSLGEYTALVAAGVLGFEDALRLVRRQGELMGEYGERHAGPDPGCGDSTATRRPALLPDSQLQFAGTDGGGRTRGRSRRARGRPG
ncbi:MAG: ACP S-malonyltransferase [Gammaproteobacteria bacterium]